MGFPSSSGWRCTALPLPPAWPALAASACQNRRPICQFLGNLIKLIKLIKPDRQFKQFKLYKLFI